jgi:hypothetical protein
MGCDRRTEPAPLGDANPGDGAGSAAARVAVMRPAAPGVLRWGEAGGGNRADERRERWADQDTGVGHGRAVHVAAGVLVVLVVATAVTVGGRRTAILLVAAGPGVALHHGAPGFTAMWRRWLATGDGSGVRLQLWIIALGSLATFPLIGGWVPGVAAYGAVAPVGLEVVLGVARFGLGMQLANGCGSGTLDTLGAGSTKMLLTLAAFIAGSLAATFHLHLWRTLPGVGGCSTVHAFGVPSAPGCRSR